MLRKLHDAHAYVLQGPTFYYHVECRATGDTFTKWQAGPRLVADQLLMLAKHSTHDLANNHGGRLVAVGFARSCQHSSHTTGGSRRV